MTTYGSSCMSYRSMPTVLSSRSIKAHLDEGDMSARTSDVLPACIVKSISVCNKSEYKCK